jgi:hypothetical protein
VTLDRADDELVPLSLVTHPSRRDVVSEIPVPRPLHEPDGGEGGEDVFGRSE